MKIGHLRRTHRIYIAKAHVIMTPVIGITGMTLPKLFQAAQIYRHMRGVTRISRSLLILPVLLTIRSRRGVRQADGVSAGPFVDISIRRQLLARLFSVGPGFVYRRLFAATVRPPIHLSVGGGTVGVLCSL